jgi:hypothetical protein
MNHIIFKVINRIDYTLKRSMGRSKSKEFYWTAVHPNIPTIFTHLLWEHYNVPRFIDFERNFMMTDQVESRGRELIDYVRIRAKDYRTDTSLLLWFDFQPKILTTQGR